MSLAAAYGLTPGAIDGLSLRECAVMVLGARERRRDTAVAVGLILDGLYNYAGMGGRRPLDFGHHGQAMLGEKGSSVVDDAMRARLHAKALARKAERAAVAAQA